MSPTKNTEETAIANINARAVNWFMGLASTVLIACFALLWNINAKLVELTERDKAHSVFEAQQDKINDRNITTFADHADRITRIEIQNAKSH